MKDIMHILFWPKFEQDIFLKQSTDAMYFPLSNVSHAGNSNVE